MRPRWRASSAPLAGVQAWVLGLLPLGVAILVRALLEPVLQDKSPFLVLTVAVMAGAYLGGARVGVVATLAGAIAGVGFITESATPHALVSAGRSVQLVLYLAECSAMTYFFEKLRQSRRLSEVAVSEQHQLALDLRRANEVKDAFLATLSHELRTPLTSIVGWSDLLVKGRVQRAEVARATTVIDRNARALRRLVDDLLDLSRIASGKMVLAQRPLDPAEPLVAAVEGIRPSAITKGIAVEMQAHGAGLVYADPDRLQQVFWNILSNALKFTPRSGRVSVTLALEEGRAIIRVQDTGPGLRPEFIPHAFERFRQDSATSSRSQGGLGLGLSIVRQLVEMHGGTVTASNAPGDRTGAAFEVALPLMVGAGDRVGGDLKLGTSARTPPLDGVRILVVDDEPDACELIASLLRDAGAVVTTTSSVEGALRDVAKARPDAILTDIAMPERDGYALLREVGDLAEKGIAPIPTGAVSAYASASDHARALSAGFAFHVAKPVEPSELIGAVSAAVPNRTGAL